MSSKPELEGKVIDLIVNDVRFPTSLTGDGSDAIVSILLNIFGHTNNSIWLQHCDPDYSCAYVRIKIEHSELVGHGLTFTIGRGTEVGKFGKLL